MTISREEVLHVARLARLELSDGEVERFAEQLSAILEAVGKVGELDLSGVEPTAHPLDLSNVWAEDEPRPSLSRRRGARECSRPRGRLVPRSRGVRLQLLHFRHAPVTDACSHRGYRVCRGPGGPLGEVWGSIRWGFR